MVATYKAREEASGWNLPCCTVVFWASRTVRRKFFIIRICMAAWADEDNQLTWHSHEDMPHKSMEPLGLRVYVFWFTHSYCLKNTYTEFLGHWIGVCSASVDTDKAFQYQLPSPQQYMRVFVTSKFFPTLFVTICNHLAHELWHNILWIWFTLIRLVSNLFYSLSQLLYYFILF